MIRAAILAALLPGAAMAVESEAALISAMAGQGCAVGPGEVADTFGPMGFTPDFVRETLTRWLVDGTASEDAVGQLALPASLCPPETVEATPKDRVIRSFAENECRLEDVGDGALERDLGLERAQLQAILYPLYEAGDLTIEGRRARLNDTLCQAADTDA